MIPTPCLPAHTYFVQYFNAIGAESLILKVPDMIQHVTPPPLVFSNSLRFWYQKLRHFVVKFGVNIPNTFEEINRNVARKLENVVTTLIKQ